MLKLKYNALALLNAFLGVLVSVLLLIVFGATGDTDAFFLSVSTVAALNMIQLSFVEQFMYFYNDYKEQSNERGLEFHAVMFIFSVFVGIVFYLVFGVFSEYVLKLFAYDIDVNRFETMQQLFDVLSIALIIYPVSYINDKVLNSEGYFAVPYVSEMMPFAVMFMVMMVVFFNYHIDIYDVALARLSGLVLGVLLNIFVIYKKIGFRFKFNNRVRLLACIKNSFLMRSAHNIHNFSIVPITNNVLSTLSEGYASLYYYALRIIVVVKSVAVGPLYKVYIARVSRFYSSQSLNEIKASKQEFVAFSVVLFSVLSVLVFLSLSFVLSKVDIGSFVKNIDVLVMIYASLILWQLAMVVESPFVGILMASKKSYVFYIVNMIFILLYGVGNLLLIDELGVYALSLSGFVAQCASVILFVNFSQYVLKKNEW